MSEEKRKSKPKTKSQNTPDTPHRESWTIFELVVFSAAALLCLLMAVLNLQSGALVIALFWGALGLGLLWLIYQSMAHLREPTHFERFKARMNLIGFGGILLALALMIGGMNFLLSNMQSLTSPERGIAVFTILMVWMGLTIYFGRFIPGRYEADRAYQTRMHYRSPMPSEKPKNSDEAEN